MSFLSFPSPLLACCSPTGAGAAGEWHARSTAGCPLAPRPLPESKSLSKKTLNSFNRWLELSAHRSKGHELSVFIAPGRFMSFSKEGWGRERGGEGCCSLLSQEEGAGQASHRSDRSSAST